MLRKNLKRGLKMENKKCKYCDKIINGYNKKHIDYLMSQHQLSKHKEKILK